MLNKKIIMDEINSIEFLSAGNFIEKLIKNINKSKIISKHEQKMLEDRFKILAKDKEFKKNDKELSIEKIMEIIDKIEYDRFINKFTLFMDYCGVENVNLRKLEKRKFDIVRKRMEPVIDETFEPLLEEYKMDTVNDLFAMFGANIALGLKRIFKETNSAKEFAASFREMLEHI